MGDSIINGVNPNGFQKSFNVKVKPYDGATTEDMIDYMKLPIRTPPDKVILHIGTNDIRNGVDTLQNLNYIEKESPSTSICLSSITTRSDKKRYGIQSEVFK